MLVASIFVCLIINVALSDVREKGNSKKTYELHLKNFEELLGDSDNVRPYIIDLFQYHVPSADAFSHEREHAGESQEFMGCFGELSPHTEGMWRTFKKHWNIPDEHDWLIIKAVKGSRLLLCLSTDYFDAYKQEATKWYNSMINSKASQNECTNQIGKYVDEMVSQLESLYSIQSQKEVLKILYNIASYYCNINDKNDKFKDTQIKDIEIILKSMNDILLEFGQRFREELSDTSKQVENYYQCRAMAGGMALAYSFDESFQKYIFLRKYHIISLIENLYELQCEESFGKPEL